MAQRANTNVFPQRYRTANPDLFTQDARQRMNPDNSHVLPRNRGSFAKRFKFPTWEQLRSNWYTDAWITAPQ